VTLLTAWAVPQWRLARARNAFLNKQQGAALHDE
jgi:hypothetical protein